jgi:hypothetical protein
MVHPLLTPQGIEKRTAPRVTYKTKAVFKAGWRVNKDCLIRDVSMKGAFLVAQERLFLDSEVLLYLPVTVDGTQNICLVTGKIVRVETKDGHPVFGYGVQFAPLSKSSAQMLRRFIDTLIPLPPPDPAPPPRK